MRRVYILILLMTVVACNQQPDIEIKFPKDKSGYEVTELGKEADTTVASEFDTTVIYVVPTEENISTTLIAPGTFHEDEISQEELEGKWIGIFKYADGIYIEESDIKAARVHDPMLDSEGEKTGWEISTMHPDECYTLVKGDILPQDENIPMVDLKQDILLPGDELSFFFLGNSYKLSAHGKMQEKDNWSSVTDYSLILEWNIKGEGGSEDIVGAQILAEAKFFDDSMITIILAGDLDGDTYPDFFIDTSPKYSFSQPTLYLSGNAPAGTLVEIVGVGSSVGC